MDLLVLSGASRPISLRHGAEENNRIAESRALEHAGHTKLSLELRSIRRRMDEGENMVARFEHLKG